MTVYAVGKISDIFNGCGVSISVHTESNSDGVDKTIEALHTDFEGLLFTNLVEFDSFSDTEEMETAMGRLLRPLMPDCRKSWEP